jgi:hypothetical protein
MVIVTPQVVIIPPHRDIAQPQVVVIPPHRDIAQPQVVIIPPHREDTQPQVLAFQVSIMDFVITSETRLALTMQISELL